MSLLAKNKVEEFKQMIKKNETICRYDGAGRTHKTFMSLEPSYMM